jgi:hypothetical protein
VHTHVAHTALRARPTLASDEPIMSPVLLFALTRASVVAADYRLEIEVAL